MTPEDMKEKLLEHTFRFDSYDKLFQLHTEELKTLKKSLNDLTEKIDRVTNRLIMAMIVVALLGENAIPLLLKLGGA